MSSTETPIKSGPFWVGVVSAAASAGIHFYLNAQHYESKYGHSAESALCDVSEVMNCSAVAASQYSEFLGVPLASLGFLANMLLLIGLLGTRYYFFLGKTRQAMPSALKILSLVIFASSLVMGFISFQYMQSYCLFCIMAYALSLISLIAVFTSYPGHSLKPSSTALSLVAASLAGTVALGYGWHFSSMSSYGGKELNEMSQLILQDWERQPVLNIATVAPTVMNNKDSAKMKIVEFADFLCPHCKSASLKIHSFLKTRPDVSLEFQAFALDGTCNPAVGHSGNGVRCYLAKMAHCGSLEKKGWPMQKKIFDDQSELRTMDIAKEKMKSYAADLKMDPGQLQECIDSEKTHKVIEQQGQLGKSIGVNSTPAVYVNGKKLQGGGSLHNLQAVYDKLKGS